MATFAEILADVYLITRRPDLEALTKMAIKSATMTLHTRNYFPKDHLDIGIQFDEEAYLQTLAYQGVVPRFRQLSYVRKAEGTEEDDITLGDFFKVLSPNEVMDRYNVHKEDVVYQSGTSLKFRSRDEFQQIIMGCWLYPSIVETDYISWIADEIPYLIILEAAKAICKTTGNREIGLFTETELRGMYIMLDSQISIQVNN